MVWAADLPACRCVQPRQRRGLHGCVSHAGEAALDQRRARIERPAEQIMPTFELTEDFVAERLGDLGRRWHGSRSLSSVRAGVRWELRGRCGRSEAAYIMVALLDAETNEVIPGHVSPAILAEKLSWPALSVGTCTIVQCTCC